MVKLSFTLPQAIKSKGFTAGSLIHSGSFAKSKIYSATVVRKDGVWKGKDLKKDICMKRYALDSVPDEWKEVQM